MKNGRLQQHASPSQVYKTPANLFVADFIGTPKINLINAEAVSVDGTVRLKCGAFEINDVPTLASGAVVAAIRPEDIHISLEKIPNAAEFKTYAVLPAGSEIIVNARCGDSALVVKETRDIEIEMDRSIWLSFDTKKINLYDRQSGDLIVSR
jgi:ABC-type sugar transport system ATPase subunit